MNRLTVAHRQLIRVLAQAAVDEYHTQLITHNEEKPMEKQTPGERPHVHSQSHSHH